jgi:hypothetical protein
MNRQLIHFLPAWDRAGGSRVRPRLLGPALSLVGSLLLTTLASAQGLTNGSLRIRVADDSGRVVPGADVTISETATGISRSARVGREGAFALLFLPTGEYEVHSERLGYRPQRVTGIPVRSGRHLDVTIRMRAALPPVHEIDTVSMLSLSGATLAGVRQSFRRSWLAHLPAVKRDLSEVFRLSSQTGENLSIEGLPESSTGIVVDGAALGSVRYPDFGLDAFRATAFSMNYFGSAELVTNDVDVEWQGSGGGYLSGHTRRGTRSLTVESFGTWSGAPVASSDEFPGSIPDFMSGNVGLFVSGPILRDTAHFALGLEAERLEWPQPRAWELDEAFDARVVSAARSAFALDLESHTRPRVLRTDAGSAFARADWQIARRHRLEMRANAAVLPTILHDGGGAPSVATQEGADFSAAAALTSQLGERTGYEVRLAGERTLRDGALTTTQAAAGDLPNTHIIEGGLEFGAPPGSGGRFERSAFSATQTFHLRTRAVHFKAGLSAGVAAYDYSYSNARNAEVFFGGVDQFARSEGAFVGPTGPLAVATFNVPAVAAYIQNTWRAAPGFELVLGLRYDVEDLPLDQVSVNEEWQSLTELSNDGLSDRLRKWSPRLAVRWDLDAESRSTVQLSAGVYHDGFEPGVMAELLTNDGRMRVRRAVGNVNGWLSQDATGGVIGRRLVLLGPNFSAPTTTRVSGGVTHALRNTALHVSTTFRRTSHLPRRTDLNLVAGSLTDDQYGRPLYGVLIQQGALLAARPGTNRRFETFDAVSALSADGSSQHWDVTARLEHSAGEQIDFFGSYTYARSTDDWMWATQRGRETLLDPGLGSAAGSADWAHASSDYDVPHKAVVGLQVRLPIPGLRPRIAGLYRFRSGPVFTPGYRDGVDANGDGSPRNDPAFVDEDLPGMSELLASWGCLREQIGRFAGRNSCRQPDLHTLDARLAFQVARVGDTTAEFVADGLNLLDATMAAPDAALVLVDPSGRLSTDSRGVITVPLMANPHFGQPLLRTSTVRALRLGLRLSF